MLGDEFFERFAWGRGFQGLVCLGTWILAPLLLGDLLGVDLLGSVRQGYSTRIKNYFELGFFCRITLASNHISMNKIARYAFSFSTPKKYIISLKTRYLPVCENLLQTSNLNFLSVKCNFL